MKNFNSLTCVEFYKNLLKFKTKHLLRSRFGVKPALLILISGAFVFGGCSQPGSINVVSLPSDQTVFQEPKEGQNPQPSQPQVPSDQGGNSNSPSNPPSNSTDPKPPVDMNPPHGEYPPEVPSHPVEPAPPQHQNKVRILTVGESNRVDVLIVIDNSGSMAFEQKNMADRFSNFINQLHGLDWQLAITTTDVSSDGPLKDGRLIEFVGMPGTYVLNSTMNEKQVRQSFASTIQRPETGSGRERGIKATYRSIERALNGGGVNSLNRSLVRDQSALVVIVVSDADETPEFDSFGRPKPDFRSEWKNVLSLIHQNWGLHKNFVFDALVVRNGDSACLNQDGNESYGLKYIEFAHATGGIVGNVCERDYGSQLKVMGQNVQELVKRVQLDCAPEGKVNITASSPGEVPPFSISGKEIQFESNLRPGKYEIQYQCRL